MTVDIREFVAARIQDDEDYARQAAEEFGTDWIEIWSAVVDLTGNDPDRKPAGASGWDTHVDTGDARVSRYMARNDPARTLREVEAKRQILAAYDRTVARFGEVLESPADTDADASAFSAQARMHATLRLLAAIYADHPDFDPEWKLEA